MRRTILSAFLVISLSVGCGDDAELDGSTPNDALALDGATDMDSAVVDAAASDAPAMDARASDTSRSDAAGGTDVAVELYGFVDFPVSVPAPSSPFDVVATVVWTHESGQEHRSEAFWDGAGQYVYRFGASRMGRWTGVTTSTEVPALSGLTFRTRVVATTEPSRVGFTGAVAGDPQGWGHQSGPDGDIASFVPVLIMWNHPSRFFDDPDQERLDIEEFGGRHGFTGCHVPGVSSAWFDASRRGNISESDLEPDPETFQAVERLVSRWAARGGHVLIQAWDQGQSIPNRLSGGAGGPIDHRISRYIAARLGPVAGWSMEYGIDLDEWVRDGQFEAWQAYLTSHLGWHHYIGARYSSGGDPGNINRGMTPREAIAFNSVDVNGLGFAGWEHWLSEIDGGEMDATRASVPDRPHGSLDRFRRRNQGRAKDFAEDDEIIGAIRLFAERDMLAIYGRYVENTNLYRISEPWPNAETIRTVIQSY